MKSFAVESTMICWNAEIGCWLLSFKPSLMSHDQQTRNSLDLISRTWFGRILSLTKKHRHDIHTKTSSHQSMKNYSVRHVVLLRFAPLTVSDSIRTFLSSFIFISIKAHASHYKWELLLHFFFNNKTWLAKCVSERERNCISKHDYYLHFLWFHTWKPNNTAPANKVCNL